MESATASRREPDWDRLVTGVLLMARVAEVREQYSHGIGEIRVER